MVRRRRRRRRRGAGEEILGSWESKERERRSYIRLFKKSKEELHVSSQEKDMLLPLNQGFQGQEGQGSSEEERE